MGKKIHEYNSINEQIKFLSNTEKEILIANFTDNNSEYKISPLFISNDKIYYFLDNTLVFYYDLNNKIVHKKTSFGHCKTNYIFSKPILFKNNLIVIATNVDMISSDIIYTKTYNNINSSGKTTNIENRKLIVSDFLINKDELYLVTKDGNIYKNSYENDFGDFVLFNSLNVSIENAIIFDDKIYFSSNNELYEFNLVTKEKKLLLIYLIQQKNR